MEQEFFVFNKYFSRWETEVTCHKTENPKRERTRLVQGKIRNLRWRHGHLVTKTENIQLGQGKFEEKMPQREVAVWVWS